MVVRGAILLVAAHAFARLLGWASAGTRAWLWSAAFVALLALPALMVLVPSWRLPAPSSLVAAFHAGEAAERPDTPAPGYSTPAPSNEPAGPGGLHVGTVLQALGALWLGGAGVLLAGLVGRHARAAALVRRAEPLNSAAWHRDANELATRSGIRLPLTLLRSDAVSVPVVTGVFRPRLLLPRDADDWPPARRRVVLLHELAHVRRRDVALKLVIDVATALHWIDPLAWLGRSRAALAREQACDDVVLAAGVAPVDYARHLLAIARRLTPPGTALAATGAAMAGQSGRSGLERRVRALIHGNGRRTPAGRLLRSVTPLALLAALWPLAALTFSAESPGPFEKAVTDPSAEVRSQAAWALGERGDGSAGPALLPLLRDPVADVRQQTAWALGELSIDAAIPNLIAALEDDHPEVRARAAWALGEMRAPAARPALTRLLSADPDPEVRAQAAWALAESSGP